MYIYNQFDREFIARRVEQFRGQIEKRLNGSLTEDEFRPLRLMNGLYLQLHAYMLRVAIPYGSLNSAQMRQLALIADKWDRGYGHFTTRQNIQFNWPKLKDVPDILHALSQVDMHAIQTSGNCIRNITSDHFAGSAKDEIEDPRPSAELLRQYSSDHPEFQFLPRKFKIGITGSKNDRALIRSNDIGIQIVKNKHGEIGYKIYVGGGLGRSPFIAKTIRDFLPKADLLPYIEAILHIYNVHGRRDNKYKARIKILIHEVGIEKIREQVEAIFQKQKAIFKQPSDRLLNEIKTRFRQPDFIKSSFANYATELKENLLFASFIRQNTNEHKLENYAILTISLKNIGAAPGDATSSQMRIIADIAEKYAHDEIRISHEQNIILPHVQKTHLPTIYEMLKQADLATPNIGLISDITACPGLDYCALATARSIPIAKNIATYFHEQNLENKIGHISVKISGCINACAHHHVGNIGILGLEKSGIENYQITLGGKDALEMQIGKRAGKGFSKAEILPAIKRLIDSYLALRKNENETFLQCLNRLGKVPFIDALYPKEEQKNVA